MCSVLTEMVESMKQVAMLDVELTVEERNLLSVGYKNVIGARRASWRILSSIEQKEENKGNSENVSKITDYRKKVEAELTGICQDILQVLDKHLISSAKSGESKVFYFKMYVSLECARTLTATKTLNGFEERGYCINGCDFDFELQEG